MQVHSEEKDGYSGFQHIVCSAVTGYFHQRALEHKLEQSFLTHSDFDRPDEVALLHLIASPPSAQLRIVPYLLVGSARRTDVSCNRAKTRGLATNQVIYNQAQWHC